MMVCVSNSSFKVGKCKIDEACKTIVDVILKWYYVC